MRFLPGNAQHIGARTSQQDSFGFADPDDIEFISHGGFLAVVCDGMGGMEHGDAASRAAIRAFLDAYSRKTPLESIPMALERSVRSANEQVLNLARTLGMVEGIGTTLVAAALIDDAMFYVSVGDSGLFHVSGGEVRTVNHPHVFANHLDLAVARGQISQETALAHPERESLTSYVGAETLDEIDRNIEPYPIQDGDTILLASDGMFKTLNPEEMASCLRGNPPTWPEILVEQTLAKRREYQDNVTVLSVTAESESRAAIPRTVLMAAPPPPLAGVPTVKMPLPAGPPSGIYSDLASLREATREAPREVPRTVMLPIEPPPLQPDSGIQPPLPIPPPVSSTIPPAAPPAPSTDTPQPWAPEVAPPNSDIAANEAAQRKNAPWMVVGAVLLVGAAGWWYWKNREPDQARQKGADPTVRVGKPQGNENRPLPALPPDAIKSAPQPGGAPVPIGVQPASPTVDKNKEQQK
jgi:PPM family protein phosphatase